jgi:uncharacterized membrane protein (UPF0127 family)
MDDLNGRKDTPKRGPGPIGINHISPNEQRWIGRAAEDLRGGVIVTLAPRQRPQAKPVHAAPKGRMRGLLSVRPRTPPTHFSRSMTNPAHHAFRPRTAVQSLAALAGLLCSAVAAQQANAPLPAIELRIGAHALRAEVARTQRERDLGLMGRPALAADGAMLFVFADPQLQCFWMRDTLVPLSVAFIADDGEVVGLADMAPHDDTPHCGSQPVRYVLEVNRGWFAQGGLGAIVVGEPFTR